ncbi:hypothetical protein B0T10DRAFT_217502 [Thelonectria olida]|uniref:Uncharacterized protein n=1 Tax=Thelonectria olida TaxID=1576542 RepID=A0A9P8WEB9_9HYPO|nr:hypothetical protein B0T10DRAFT_217502 [Thelonectria olida]
MVWYKLGPEAKRRDGNMGQWKELGLRTRRWGRDAGRTGRSETTATRKDGFCLSGSFLEALKHGGVTRGFGGLPNQLGGRLCANGGATGTEQKKGIGGRRRRSKQASKQGSRPVCGHACACVCLCVPCLSCVCVSVLHLLVSVVSSLNQERVAILGRDPRHCDVIDGVAHATYFVQRTQYLEGRRNEEYPTAVWSRGREGREVRSDRSSSKLQATVAAFVVPMK